jgi:ribonuclease HI
MLSWQTIKGICPGSNRGKVPKWFEYIRGKITSEGSCLKDKWNKINWQVVKEKDQKFYCEPAKDKRIKEWCCYRDAKDNIIWGKVKKKGVGREEDKWQLYHYERISEGSRTIFEECNKNCEYKDTSEEEGERINNRENSNIDKPQAVCVVTVEKEKVFACNLLNRGRSNHRKPSMEIHCRTDTLEENVPRKQTDRSKEQTEELIEVLIEDWDEKIIRDLIEPGEHRDGIIERLWNNKKAQARLQLELEYEYYTDGSLIDRGTEGEIKETKMGAAWIQTEGPVPLSSFKCGVVDWPSSCRAEVTAILVALLATPKDSKVNIKTDSRNCIETFRSLSRIDPKRTYRRWLKIKNWSIWSNIMEVIKKKNINLSLKKVKAHSGVRFNEVADQLAKEANQLTAIKWIFKGCKNIQTAIKWQGIIVEKAPREFIKEIVKTSNLCKWIEQKRNRRLLGELVERQKKVAWKHFWLHLQIKGLHTSFKESNKRSFRVKMLHNELPTLEKLTERKPHLYGHTNNKCRLCSQELETREHLFDCMELEQLNVQAWERTMAKMIKTVEKMLEREQRGEVEDDKAFKFQCEMAKGYLTKKIFKERDDRMKFALGIVQTETILNLSRVLGGKVSMSKASQILSEASAKFLESFRKTT